MRPVERIRILLALLSPDEVDQVIQSSLRYASLPFLNELSLRIRVEHRRRI